MTISKRISEAMKSSSWIRAMFEEAERLKREYGEDSIYDFTLGNPIVEPPQELKRELIDAVNSNIKGMHRYMSNSGYEWVREEIASFYREKTGLPFTNNHIIMTVGAAGGINVVLKAIIDPGDEVIVPSPFFVEFMFYIENHAGIIRLVDTKADFHLDISKIEEAITPKTKAILLNSPNNPTGVVYNQKELEELALLLKDKAKAGHRIFIISDEAYKKLIYNNIVFPDLFLLYEDTIKVLSHSKDLALPGERIGYIAISPLIQDANELIGAAIFANRILGFINAPAIMQRLVGKFQRNSVDINEYQKKRDALYAILREAGFEVALPDGAFYIFPKSPIEDDIQFVMLLQKHRVLAVPGIGFGKKGYLRLAYCVEMETIEKAAPYFKEVMEEDVVRQRKR
jgi:aspartate aminotransferase